MDKLKAVLLLRPVWLGIGAAVGALCGADYQRTIETAYSVVVPLLAFF